MLFLYRSNYYKNDRNAPQNQEDGAPAPDTSEIIVAKNRHGELADVPVSWSGEFTQFTALDTVKRAE